MQITARLSQIAPMQTGTSKSGSSWKNQDIILEIDGPTPRKVAINFYGDKTDRLSGLKPGQEITVHFEPSSREHEGKWYTKLDGWKIESGAAQPAPAQNLANIPTSDQDLPF